VKATFHLAHYRKAPDKARCCKSCDYKGNHRGLFLRCCSLFEQWEILDEKPGHNTSSREISEKHDAMLCDYFKPQVERIRGHKPDTKHRYWKIQELDMEGRYVTETIKVVRTEPDTTRGEVAEKWLRLHGWRPHVEQTTPTELQNEIDKLKDKQRLYANAMDI